MTARHSLDDMTSSGPLCPTRVRHVLPALRGRGVLLAAAADADRVRQALAGAGYAVAEADLGAPRPAGRPAWGDAPPAARQEPAADTLDADPAPTTLRTAQAAIAAALRLPETAGRNLDALVDSLRDLATWWPDDEHVVLLLHRAESLVAADLPGWHTLTEILREASADLWRGGEPGDRAFETVALVHQHGVPALPEDEDDDGTPLEGWLS